MNEPDLVEIAHMNESRVEVSGVHAERVDSLRVNESLGLGAKGWMAQFGAVGLICVLVLIGAWHVLRTTERLQETVMSGVREMHQKRQDSSKDCQPGSS